MGITNEALSVLAANMTGSKLPTHTAIGTGSLVFSGNQTTLDNETDRNAFTSSDLSTSGQVTFVTDFSPVSVSGTILKEFGTMTTGSSMLSREVLAGSLVFDGEQELQIQYTFQFFN